MKKTALIRFCMLCGSMFTVIFKIHENPEYAIVKCPTCSYRFKATVFPSGIITCEETMEKNVLDKEMK